MFSYTDSVADDGLLSSGSVDGLRDAGRTAQRLERQAAARKILAAYRMWVTACGQATGSVDQRPRVKNGAEKVATGEVSVAFGVSKKMVGRWIELATLLQDLPRLRLAFLEGEYSTNRVGLIARAVSRVDPEDRVDAEARAIECANETVTDPELGEQLDEMVIELNPAKAASDVEDFAREHQDVVITNKGHGHSTVEATVYAEDGAFLDRRINALIGRRLCRHDPRTFGERRAEAYREIIRVAGARLRCRCDRADCSLRSVEAPMTSRPRPSRWRSPSSSTQASQCPISPDTARSTMNAPRRSRHALLGFAWHGRPRTPLPLMPRRLRSTRRATAATPIPHPKHSPTHHPSGCATVSSRHIGTARIPTAADARRIAISTTSSPSTVPTRSAVVGRW